MPDAPDPAQLKQLFWKALAHSPFLFLQRDADPDSAAPMTAQLDREAHSAVWFFTSRSGPYAAAGPATATFAAKGHDLFARISGSLGEETDRAQLDKLWSPMVESWFAGGKADPDLLFLRLDLRRAEIWHADLGVIGMAKMMLGFDVREDVQGDHVTTAL